MTYAETPLPLDYGISLPVHPETGTVTITGRLAPLAPGQYGFRVGTTYGAATDLDLLQDLDFRAGTTPLAVLASGPGAWTVDHPGGPLAFSYRLRVDPQAHGLTLTDPGYDEMPHRDHSLFFALGELILLRPDHLPLDTKAGLRWSLPPGWAAFTPWPDAAVPDLDALLENYLLAAPRTRPIHERLDGFAYRLVWPGREDELFSEATRTAIRRVFASALALFGGASRPLYQIIIKDVFHETALAGSPKRDSIQLSVPRSMTGDELAGFQDEVFYRVLAHEFFHTWTARAFTTGDPDAVSESYWLGEGFNDYLSLLALARAGILSPADLARTFHERLTQQAGPGVLDLVAASREFLTDSTARQRSYDLGSLVALELDIKLRHAGHGGIRDFIALLIERGGVPPEDSAALIDAWRAFAPEPLKDELARAIHDPRPIDAAALLDLMGVEPRQTGQSLGFDAVPAHRDQGLCFVAAGEIAAGQGLEVGDCLLTVDGWEAKTPEDLFMALDPERDTTLGIRRGQASLTLAIRPLLLPVYGFIVAPDSPLRTLGTPP